MQARPAAVELLAALAGALGSRRWYLFGAQAVNVYGRPRTTADVDVTVELDRGETTSFLAALRSAGFDLRVPDPDAFVKATSVFPFVHRGTGMPLDVVLAGSGLEAMFLDRARPVDVGGLVVPVIDAADLVVAKILAGRPKDHEDAAAVLRERATDIDVAAVRSLVVELEGALGQSDLTPALERAIAEARIASPRPRGRSRRATKQR